MFQYYKKVFFSNIFLFVGGGEGMASSPRPEAKPEGFEEQVAQQKLEAARVKLAQMGTSAEVAKLEEAVAGITGTAREQAGELLLAKVVENFMTNNGEMRNGGFESASFGNDIQFDGTNDWTDTDALSAADVAILARYGIDQGEIIAALNNYNTTIATVGNAKRGGTAEEIIAYRDSQKAPVQTGGDGSEALISEMETQRAIDADMAASDRMLIEKANTERLKVGEEMLASYVEKFFTENTNLISEDFHAESNGIEYNDGTLSDTQVMPADMMADLVARGISPEKIVAAFEGFKETQVARNTMNQYADARTQDIAREDDRQTSEAYAEYAESRAEGERIAAMENAYASMPEDARSRDVAQAAATTKLADIFNGGDIKFSQLKQNPEAVKALQTALNAAGFDVGGIDGNYGPKTTAAVLAFQKSVGETGTAIAVDGQAGKETLTALLGKMPATSPLDTGNTGTMMADTPHLDNGTVYAGDTIVPRDQA